MIWSGGTLQGADLIPKANTAEVPFFVIEAIGQFVLPDFAMSA